MPDRTFHIRAVLNNQPLGVAMQRLLPREDRAGARRLILGRHVHVNGNLAPDPDKRLKTGDVVKVFEHPRAAPPTAADVRVRYIDEHMVVIEKPAGITTMRESDGRSDGKRRDRTATLEEVLQRVVRERVRAAPRVEPRVESRAGESKRPARHPLARREGASGGPGKLARRGPLPESRPSSRAPEVIPVHRLDRDTSGLMLFALSPEAETALTRMFREHAVERKYQAVVHGHPAARTVESWLVRDRGDGLRGSSPRGKDAPGAQHAVTHVTPVEAVGDYTIVECRLQTGRTHQIRIHLTEIGHMLCGERTYNRPAPGAQPLVDRSGAPRQALHSAELNFTHPVTGKQMRFTSEFPTDLADWLGRIRRAK